MSGSNDGAKSSSQSESKGSRSDMDPPADRGERGQSRGGARGGKPNPAGNDSGLGGFTAPPGPNLDSEIERYVSALLHSYLASSSFITVNVSFGTTHYSSHNSYLVTSLSQFIFLLSLFLKM